MAPEGHEIQYAYQVQLLSIGLNLWNSFNQTLFLFVVAFVATSAGRYKQL